LRRRCIAALWLAGAPLACVLERNPAFDGASTSSTGVDVTSTSTTSTSTDDGSATEIADASSSPTATVTTSVSEASSSSTGDPMASCGDGDISPGERCHAALPAVGIDVNPREFAAGDLVGDGLPDVVVAAQDAVMPVLLGTGEGALALDQSVMLPYDNHIDVALGDIDEDDDLDAVLASASHGVLVAGPWGAGVFEPPIASTNMGQPQAIGVGDFEETPGLDVLYVNNGMNARVAVGDGAGTFTRVVELDVPLGADNSIGVTVGALDGDRWRDAVTIAGGNATRLTVLHGAPTGPTMGEMHVTENGIGDVAIADLDGDGTPELVAVSQNQITVAVLGESESSFAMAGTPVAVGAADFDVDGHVDLAIVYQNVDQLVLLYGDGSLAPTESVGYSVGGNPVALAIADFDGDTIADIVVVSRNNPGLHVVASAP
jgi:hypothetical protein